MIIAESLIATSALYMWVRRKRSRSKSLIQRLTAQQTQSEQKKVQLFVTCLVDALCPQVGLSVVEILEAQGFAVEFPMQQTCCGQPAFNAGHWAEAREMARHTLDVLSQTEGPIIIPSGSCTDMIGHHYPEILADDPHYAQVIKDIASRPFEFTQFLVDELGLTDLGVKNNRCVTYHPSCHGLRNLNLRTQAPTLLSHVDGLSQVPLPEAEQCCGFGGLFSVKMSDISGSMLERKLDQVEATKADTLLGGDISCLIHMAGGLEKRGSEIEVKHIAEILAG